MQGVRKWYFVTARKRSLRRLYFYTCLSFCPRGGVPAPGGFGCLLLGGGGLVQGGGAWWRPSRRLLLRAVCILLECILVSQLLLPPANKVWGKVIFSQASVCPQLGETPPDRDPPETPLYDKERAVRILQECILVLCDGSVRNNSYAGLFVSKPSKTTCNNYRNNSTRKRK